MIDRRNLLNLDWSLLATSLTLVVIGVLCIHSATHHTVESGMATVAIRQIQWAIASGFILLSMLVVDYRTLVRWGYAFYFVAIVVLLLVLAVGSEIKGSKSWIRLGLMNWQPSEQVKIFLALALSRYFARLRERLDSLTTWSLIIPGALFAVPILLILKQPDLGVAMTCVPIFVGIIFVSNLRYRTIAFWCILGMISVPVAFEVALKPYQKQRVLTLLDPESDLKGSGWQTVQSKIAVGSGTMLGRGYLKGKQSQLGFIPEQHTDFIFSVLAEEFGFLGSSLVIMLYFFLFSRSLKIAAMAKDREGALLVTGLVSYMVFQSYYNVAMVLGIVPITGIPLVFMSYGGSSLIGSAMALGLILNVRMRNAS